MDRVTRAVDIEAHARCEDSTRRTLLACVELLISRSAFAPRSSASGSNDDVTVFFSSFAQLATAGAATAAAPTERRAPYAETALRSIVDV